MNKNFLKKYYRIFSENIHVIKLNQNLFFFSTKFQWLRAKYINRLVTKHNALKSFTKWSTRDIVLFGRWFGYTPKSVLNLKESNVKKEIEPDVCDDAESQLAIENCPTDTISLNEKLTKWLDEVEEKSSKSFIKTINDEPFIVVDEDDDESSNRKASPLKNNRNCVQLPIESGHKEIMWINEVCRRTQIRFEEEEIDDGKRISEIFLSF